MYGLARNMLVSLIHVLILPIFPLDLISFLTIGKQNAASVNAKRYSIYICLDTELSVFHHRRCEWARSEKSA
jgi:hypothetical protein